MLTGLFSAATSLSATEHNQEVVARNLAHVNVPGFRRTLELFTEREQETPIDPRTSQVPWVGVQDTTLATDFSAGVYNRTDRKLDLAVHGDGFFVVNGPGGELYTRNGVFLRDDNGRLVNSNGMAVQGEGGDINIPASASDSQIRVNSEGTVFADGTRVGKLQVVTFADKQRLKPIGTTLFSAPSGVRPQESEAVVEQGVREMSNVNSMDELVRMISGIRKHEASSKILETLNRILEQQTQAQDI